MCCCWLALAPAPKRTTDDSAADGVEYESAARAATKRAEATMLLALEAMLSGAGAAGAGAAAAAS
jgi:hypothetical protein